MTLETTDQGGPGGRTSRQERRHGFFWRWAFFFVRKADTLSEWTGLISKWVVLPTLILGVGNVILRYTGQLVGVRLTNNGLIEAQWYLYSLIFLLGFNYILKNQINVRVDFWFAHQPKKKKAWIDLIGHHIALLPFAILGLWLSVPQVITSWRLNEQSPDPSGLPRAPIKTMIPVAFALLLIQTAAELVKLWAIVTDRPEEVDRREAVEAPLRLE